MVNINVSVPAIEKLVDYTASGVGAIAGTIVANWRAHKEGRAKLAAATYDADVRRIEAESRAQSILIIEEAQTKARQSIEASTAASQGTVEITAGDITQSIEFQSRKRIENVRSVVEDAADELGDETVPEHEPDHDWTACFFDFAQDVSNEDMRKIWARILAGEVRAPGQTSMRTMETLRNMTQRDAELFRRLCGYAIDHHIVFNNRREKDGYRAFSVSELLHLQECGLVHPQSDIGIRLRFSDNGSMVLRYQNELLLLEKPNGTQEELLLPAIGLTSAGAELSEVVDSTVEIDYLRALATYLRGMDITLDYLEGIEELADGSRRYAKRTRIDLDSGP